MRGVAYVDARGDSRCGRQSVLCWGSFWELVSALHICEGVDLNHHHYIPDSVFLLYGLVDRGLAIGCRYGGRPGRNRVVRLGIDGAGNGRKNGRGIEIETEIENEEIGTDGELGDC